MLARMDDAADAALVDPATDPGLARHPRVARLAESSLLIVGAAVLATFLTAVITFVWGFAKVWSLVDLLFDEGSNSSLAIVRLLEVIDVYLLGTVMLIIAIGLVELFVTPVQLPQWLEIHSLDDLKGKIIDVIQLVAAIKFLEKLVLAKEPLDALWYGLAVAAVILALLAVRMVKLKSTH
jgi:uncharacterized membrane protein YqhA